MCGICGMVSFDGPAPDRERRVAAMSRALRHRGPDDRGSWSDDDVALGFRRLSVIDLETGQQPVRLENDRAVLVFNGEIYNYRELRGEIEGRQRFRSRGDAEVILRLWDELGDEAFTRLNGMFAIALWDKRRRALTLVRDRFGIKPLYLHRDGGTLVFASELRALLAAGFPRRRELDAQALHGYLEQRYVPPGRSIVRGVTPLPPATWLRVDPEGTTEHRYWTPPPIDETVPTQLDERVEERLAAAAKRQLVADVPVGVFLSGGLDSGTLAALARRAEPGALRTFSVGFDDPSVANELDDARVSAAFLDSEHHELTVDGPRVAGDLAAILADLDEPLGDATCLPTWYLSRLARERAVVALSGEGADEVFGGYERQRYDVWIDRLGPLGRRWLPAAMKVGGRPGSARLVRRLSMVPSAARVLDWSRVFDDEEIVALTGRPRGESDAALEAAFRDESADDPVSARLSMDRRLFLPGDLLPKVDRMSMAHSLEVRVPYLDHELVDAILPLPGAVKVGRKGKRLLRRVAQRIAPPIARRPKRGFDVPIAVWLRGPLREPLRATLGATRVLDGAPIAAWLDDHLAGRADHGQRLWTLLVLESWWRGLTAADAAA